ncbi:alpha beta-hydrolase [Suillus clintonianus]|uniref:alpha beta-hydrolase n=1 Tax=Suillus clintonianus TaxID=1904413 RepID=UPI001B878AE0|nr:alpha beta-hydrolase [Suillus clintonianus]KAG2125787.1 alpha beta-hydrolase [Suillus clintonianus]
MKQLASVTFLALLLQSSSVDCTTQHGFQLPAPIANLDDAIFTGTFVGDTAQFLGIPFAQPPIGSLRLQVPQPLPPYQGQHTASTYGPACHQHGSSIQRWIVPGTTETSEDCLTLNVFTPAVKLPGSTLPVIVFLFPGAFETGSGKSGFEDVLVSRSVLLDEPVIYVSLNYRLSAWGFLASEEVKRAGTGNLGLRDQRLALHWVQKYISAFGGDPAKVTIWGESAGAISVALQMLAYDGNNEGLFRAAFMQSGSPTPMGDITHGQRYYDFIVDKTGCKGSNDTLECLRGVPGDVLHAAVDKTPSSSSYQALALAWMPRADGIFLTDNFQRLVKEGKIANVPFITGSCDDEGTLFSFSTTNITTSEDFRGYLETYWAPNATNEEIDGILDMYSEDPIKGSPFDTGNFDKLTSQFKRIAAFQGDSVFQAPRRFLLSERSGKQNTWAYLNKGHKAVPLLGSFHGSDFVDEMLGGSGSPLDYLIRFAAHLDPNANTGIFWPQYTAESKDMLMFGEWPWSPPTIIQDTYREEAMEYLINFGLAHPL